MKETRMIKFSLMNNRRRDNVTASRAITVEKKFHLVPSYYDEMDQSFQCYINALGKLNNNEKYIQYKY